MKELSPNETREPVTIMPRRLSLRKFLYLIYIPLLITEWAADIVTQIWGVFHKSIETLTLATQRELHEPFGPKSTEQIQPPGTPDREGSNARAV